MKNFTRNPFTGLFNFTHTKFMLVLALASALSASSQNLITNGDFESGGAGTGFQTNYFNTSGPSVQRNYAIVSNPNTINPAFSSSCVDHTTGTGKMMVVDGSSSSGDKVWEAVPTGGIPVTSGSTYTFSYWIQSVSTTNAVGNLADLEVRFNNTVLTPTSGSTVCPSVLCSWTKVTYTWTATSGYAQIWIYDKQTSATGNDFALDDISLIKNPDPLSVNYSVINPTCTNINNGIIVVYGAGGTPPYTYSLNGGPYSSNNIFTGLSASTGNYVSIKDASTPTLSVTSASNINITSPANPIIIRPDTTINAGANVVLWANGTNGSYIWQSSPNDPTLTNPLQQNTNVQPTVTTTYTVNSTNTSTQNLVFNPGFELGNIGFTTDYTFYTYTTNHKSYGITTNPYLFDNFFINSTDHSGTGNMMVVDGSDQNGGTDRVWCQTIPVKTNTNYTFSYWIQTVATPSPALIETQVNGSPITGNAINSTFTASSNTDGWSQVSYSWNSGSNTTAQICLYDRNTVGTGNDFALDDIEFLQTNTCDVTKSVVVTVSNTTPVTLVSFTAEWKDSRKQSGLLKWQTVTEINNRYFELQCSVDAINFTTVAILPGAGNSNGILNYSRIDNYPSRVPSAIYYYRLRLVDFNGQVTYSKIASIKRNTSGSSLIVTSLPGTGILQVQSQLPIRVFSLLDASGKRMIEPVKNLAYTIDLNTGRFATGIYVYEAQLSDDSIVRGKVFIRH